jgi:hypothetical protein
MCVCERERERVSQEYLLALTGGNFCLLVFSNSDFLEGN